MKKKKIFIYLAQSLAVLVIYFLAGKFSLDLNQKTGFTNLIFIPTGIGIGALLLFGYKVWPSIFLGMTLISIVRGAPLPYGSAIVVISTLEALFAAYLLKSVLGFQNSLERVSDVAKLTLIVAPVVSLLSAIPGVMILMAYRPTATWATLLTWWSGHLVASIIIIPLLLVWNNNFRLKGTNSKELLLLILALIVYGIFIFLDPFTGSNKTFPFVYPIFLFLLWTIWRFTQRETVTVIFIISFVLIIGTIFKIGPFNFETMKEGFLSLKSFLVIFAISGMLTAASFAERKELERRKDNFIGMASHELKTPLTSVKMIVQLLYKKHKEQKDHKEVEYLQTVNQQVNKMTHLINDMLDLSKIQAGKLKMRKESFQLETVVDQSIKGMQMLTDNNTIVVEGDFSAKIQGDRDRISQVIMNLLSNAITYSPANEKIIVSGSKKDTSVIIGIQDFGVGIPEKKIHKIFERFYRADEKKQTNGGFGLGLYIAAEIVKQHNGRIWVESQRGKGSTFYFTLPLV